MACADASVVRTWLIRATLHMVPAGDVRWMVSLLGPMLVAKYRRRRAQLGLDEALCARAMRAIPQILTGRTLTRASLVQALARRGVDLPPGQAHPHLLMYAAGSGLLCRAADDGAEPTYALLDEWIAPAPAVPAQPAVELARRYFAAFAPASAADFAAWSGLPSRTAAESVSALGEELNPVRLTTPGSAPMRAPLLEPDDGIEPAEAGIWRLLGAFDTYLVGYRSRELYLDPRFARRINAGGGWVHPAVVRDGRIVGRWRLHPSGTVAAELFDEAPRAAEDALAAEAADIGRFLDRPVRLEISAAADAP